MFHMLNEDPGGISFSEIGGLGEQIRELREVIELPLTNPELFIRVGIKPPKVTDNAALVTDMRTGWFTDMNTKMLHNMFLVDAYLQGSGSPYRFANVPARF